MAAPAAPGAPGAPSGSMVPMVAAAAAVAASLLAGCSPALDWREVRPAGTAVVVLLPCKPNVSARTVQLAGRPVRLSMHACKADDLTWALAAADVEDPGQVGPALLALRESTRANLQGQVVEAAAAAVRGATPHEAQASVLVRGRRQDGKPASAQFVVFSHGTQVFQAIVLGDHLSDAAAQMFFDSLRAGR